MGDAEGYLQGIDDYTVIKMCTIGEKSVLIDSLISVSLDCLSHNVMIDFVPDTYDAFKRTEKAETFDGYVQVNRYDAEGLRHEL